MTKVVTLPKTNSSPPKMDGWKTVGRCNFLNEMVPFRGTFVHFRGGKTVDSVLYRGTCELPEPLSRQKWEV